MNLTELAQHPCTACQANAPQVSDAEQTQLMLSLPDWSIVNCEGVLQLIRSFSFKNFKQAWDFTHQVAELAESEFHHPTITLEWGKVTVIWWTHAINGLHHNDFIMAARTDILLNEKRPA